MVGDTLMSDLKHLSIKQLDQVVKTCQSKIAYHQSIAEGQKVRLWWAREYIKQKESLGKGKLYNPQPPSTTRGYC